MYSIEQSPTVFVIGNGVSRLHLNIHGLGSMYPTVGCNALARSFLPTILVTADKDMTLEIQEQFPNGYPGYHVFKTKPQEAWSVTHKRKREASLKIPGWASGGVALYCACYYFSPVRVIVVGFDLDWTIDKKVNNIYAGTDHYQSIGSKPTPHDNFTHQFQVVAGQFAHVNFYRMIPCNEAINIKLMGVQNIKQIVYEDFRECDIPYLT